MISLKNKSSNYVLCVSSACRCTTAINIWPPHSIRFLRQTFADFEVIISDNASTDRTEVSLRRIFRAAITAFATCGSRGIAA